jgi:hypothetical protein
MSSDTTCFHVGIIGPSDTSAEVGAALNAISDLNTKLSKRGITIAGHHWSQLPPGVGEPQGYIDDLLAWSDIDFVVGFMRSHFGSPVGEAKSGTEHEARLIVELNQKRGSPDLLFYFHKGALQASAEIAVFASWLQKVAMTGSYDAPGEVFALLKEHLEAKIHSRMVPPTGIPQIRGILPTNRRITVEWIISARMTDEDLPIPTIIGFKNGSGEEYALDTRSPVPQGFANWISRSMGFAAKEKDTLLRYLQKTNQENVAKNARIGQTWLGNMEIVAHRKFGKATFMISLAHVASANDDWPKLQQKLEQGFIPLPAKQIFINAEGTKEYRI